MSPYPGIDDGAFYFGKLVGRSKKERANNSRWYQFDGSRVPKLNLSTRSSQLFGTDRAHPDNHALTTHRYMSRADWGNRASCICSRNQGLLSLLPSACLGVNDIRNRYDIRYRSSVAHRIPHFCGDFPGLRGKYSMTYRKYATAYLIRYALVTGLHPLWQAEVRRRAL
jgi:hypothetical protein